MKNFGLDIWSNKNFIIEDGQLKLNYKSMPSLLEIVEEIRADDVRGPILLRFPHLIKRQITSLYSYFDKAMKENLYEGSFNAVFPLKVNQFPHAVEAVTSQGKDFNYGLEAGSKAELILAMSKTPYGANITVNGFKDKEMITLGFIAAQSGHNITITIEGIGELETIIEVAQECNLKVPNIGIRVRLHSAGSGIWAKSGGMDAKFGLTSTEIIETIRLLREQDLLQHLRMVHFHIGSQMSDIAPLKRALREAGNIYAELKRMGASALDSINIGGGLAVEYDQHTQSKARNYSIEEFSNSVVFALKEIMNAKNVKHPDIFTESGRFIVASHAVLITPVLELFTHDYQEHLLDFKEVNPPLIEELIDLNKLLNNKNCTEYLHDALDHMESILTLFDLGYIDLQDRSNAEILVHNIIKKALYLNPTDELDQLHVRLQERYLINASIFQSLPDYWGLDQNFPVMPLHHLNSTPIRAASLWDITCDSDGEIGFKPDRPLYLHDVNLDEEEYFLGFFNVGAYQETLGMNHNLFTHPSEYTVHINDTSYEIKNAIESKNILDILESIGYSKSEILNNLKSDLLKSDFITEQEKDDTLAKLETFLEQNGYLRTTN
ncbi:MAG: biosynthetic arginine decarboxylase [Epsilonproteobacteria bacterium]|nr:biosynthetic arginine decarboxylase [Campylobacterota bacterium]PIP11205.1 MAG: arginine decarboxylase [Sulfurimonas sp. CG23_combo_of_CG06-09_8_20_14_all_36_33]PIS27090.1 MAG: arginine decarboxylase [Sulfurimonas sp. CG08_land_8_20_14_0_20_36_33]PIU33696.1 MAG: arginine decarboxylase [Sulfurimonas sp. CG07_land_8_20_14_0_80_36_56]PIV05294.1 MAG: arginine decarboxylase [Sulfurimonas sp. CG03_land_8_20_14_0_80_36_25]PIV34548.1 MAG: arginine decarboxylase [Sulfurimonas sp. CG02_land_8_20_14_3